MKRLLKKVYKWSLGILVFLVFNLSLCPAEAMGSVGGGLTVEQAEQIIRNSFSVPEDYSQLSTEFNEYADRSVYSLNWASGDESGGGFYAEVDAVSGEVLRVNQWEYQPASSDQPPALTEKEAEKTALELVAKLVPKHLPELKAVKDGSPDLSIDLSQSLEYNFHWIRIVNGIPFPANGVSISISGENGKVISYSYNWTQGMSLPTPLKLISSEQASQVFKDTPMLELHYFLPPGLDPEAGETQRALLVYQLSNKYYGGAIDAFSGRPVTFEPQGVAFRAMSTAVISAFEAASEDNDSSVSQDSPEKPRQISQKEAVNIVKKLIGIPKGFLLSKASLNPDWQNPEEQVWELNWNSDTHNKEGFLNARVNANTGDLISMDLSTGESLNSSSLLFTRQEAQKYADNFLQRVQPGRFEEVEGESKAESESYFQGIIPKDVQVFTYARIVNGIPVSQDGMSVLVDTAAKQVIYYDMSWSRGKFPTTAKVLAADQAAADFLTLHPLKLNYVLILHPNGQVSPRLVYQPQIDGGVSSMLDAETGNPLDWSGKAPDR